MSAGSDKDMPMQRDSNYFMWSAPNPCNGQTGPKGLYGKMKVNVLKCPMEMIDYGS